MTKVHRHRPPAQQAAIQPKPDLPEPKVQEIAVEQFKKMKIREKVTPILEERTFRVVPALCNVALFAAAVFATKWMVEY